MSTSTLTLDIEALTLIAGYAHWIPITQGIYKEFFIQNYPGWEWNQIIPELIKKDVLKVNSQDVNQRRLAQGLSISIEIESVTITKSKGGITITVKNRKTTKTVRSN